MCHDKIAYLSTSWPHKKFLAKLNALGCFNNVKKEVA